MSLLVIALISILVVSEIVGWLIGIDQRTSVAIAGFLVAAAAGYFIWHLWKNRNRPNK
jgi:uncharacterized membrane protein